MPRSSTTASSTPLSFAHPALRTWFTDAFEAPTVAQCDAWPSIARGENTLLLAPTGSGKTLAAFLVALNRLVFSEQPPAERTTVVYVSPLKALGVDVERNLRAPLAGMCATAARLGFPFREPSVGIRTGDTSAKDRQSLIRHPPDILITTPESLFLMLTSRARETLTEVQTVIVDEIHAMVSSKRGAHLMLSLERVEALRTAQTAMQRIGLSATQRSLEEVANFLGGRLETEHGEYVSRPVVIVDAGRTKAVEVRVEVPVEDMVAGAAAAVLTKRSADEAAPRFSPPTIWEAIHPRLVELIRAHRSTLIFVNSRRLAERLSAAINEKAGEELSLTHHGSLSKERRLVVEDLLKRGKLRALVATSSLELGIDMGAVDLVILVEPPHSVASAMQRIGRAGHSVGETSKAVIFPKHRGDLLPCATMVEQVKQGLVETSVYPRSPLDVLAQHIVSALVVAPTTADDVYDWVRCAAPFAQLPRASFDGVLDMLSGRYPSERFRELRPRINWDRVSGVLSARRGARLLVVSNGSVIVDRGLYGVFLVGSQPPVRVGELDEEMVFECRVGDVFVLGVSSWRIEEIQTDRVLVTPAPGEPGRMPFWHGDKPGRPLEMGRAIGALTRRLTGPNPLGAQRLVADYGLDDNAARNLVAYVASQVEKAEVPTDRKIVVESFLDEVGDWRVVVLSPFGGAVHAPWSIIVGERLRERLGMTVDSMWADDGLVFRLPEVEAEPESDWFIPLASEAEEILTRALGGTALFAAHFRENAARSLLLPRRKPGQRLPLWVQRRRSADLLSLASEFPDFPVVLETYRECLRDKFDLRGLQTVLTDIERGSIGVARVRSTSASPFASTLLFSYVAQFMYATDAPLAERRAQALSLDMDQLRQLLGTVQVRGLFDPAVIARLEAELQYADGAWQPRDKDDLLDVFRRVGDLSEAELSARFEPTSSRESDSVAPPSETQWRGWLEQLRHEHAVALVRMWGQPRYIATEDASRYRDALGITLPIGLPAEYLASAKQPLEDLLLRYAKTHGPFAVGSVATRFRLGVEVASHAIEKLEAAGLLVRGEFLIDGDGIEFVHPDVLRRLRRFSLAELRHELEPLDGPGYTRFLLAWHGIGAKHGGLDAVLNVIEQLHGNALGFGVWTREIFPTRVSDFSERDLDELCSAGEVVWRASGSASDPRIAFYLTDAVTGFDAPSERVGGAVAERIRTELAGAGLFFPELVERVGGFPGEVFDTLWAMIWSGEVSNDSLRPLRSLLRGASERPRGAARARSSESARRFRSRRRDPGVRGKPGTEGRFTLLPSGDKRAPTDWLVTRVRALVKQWGVVTREAVAGAKISGGFAAAYPVLRSMDETGELQRGYWIEGLGASQFVPRGVVNQLRLHRVAPREESWAIVAATDPANPYGACLAWPELTDAVASRPSRLVGSAVILERGRPLLWLGPGLRQISTFRPPDDNDSDAALLRLAEVVRGHVDARGVGAVLIEQINGEPPSAWLGKWKPPLTSQQSFEASAWSVRFVRALVEVGFENRPSGLARRRHSTHLSRLES